MIFGIVRISRREPVVIIDPLTNPYILDYKIRDHLKGMKEISSFNAP